MAQLVESSLFKKNLTCRHTMQDTEKLG